MKPIQSPIEPPTSTPLTPEHPGSDQQIRGVFIFSEKPPALIREMYQLSRLLYK
ncbi:hypothetical protein [Larkinella rosea]|uniref:hypothetical protein n=1 Tax=Larkinella rosea TaxID=2025312 RepID=UPI00163A866D|nr:hypothetical protein [Larkinella rosea]